jgi:hypothetical protein
MKLTAPPTQARVLALWVAPVAVALLLTCSPKRQVDTRGWRLAEFIDHLNTQGIKLRVIPTRRDGRLVNDAYLTERPDETWLSFQRKVKSVQQIEQWRGSVWVVWNDPREGGIVHFASPSWGRHGCQIGDFLLFGDDRLIERIQRAFR